MSAALQIEWEIIEGDCLEALKGLQDESVDALVTDPPAGINFMSRNWDDDKGGRDAWVEYMAERFRECLRVLKPGAHGLVWAIPRTSHWTAWALEGAGFEVRDVVTHLFGSGFPKSLDVSKAIDKAAGAEREVVGVKSYPREGTTPVTRLGKTDFYSEYAGGGQRSNLETAPATDAARQWNGWGTSLKPASEHWILVRKPLIGSVAENVLEHGTGGLNIDAARIGYQSIADKASATPQGTPTSTTNTGAVPNVDDLERKEFERPEQKGRWPANVTLEHTEECEFLGTEEGEGYAINRFTDGAKPFGDGAGHPYESEAVSETVEKWRCHPECPVRMLDEQSGITTSTGGSISGATAFGQGAGWNEHQNRTTPIERMGDSGGASRFFYTAKASKSERNEGLKGQENKHPTVKSAILMEHLIKLITPPGGLVLDAFMGSGSTGVAGIKLGRSFVGIEQEKASADVARARLEHATERRTDEQEIEDQQDIFDLLDELPQE